MSGITCKCGAPATCQIVVALRSSRGVAWRTERPTCDRCGDRLAWHELAAGAVSVEGRRLA